MSVSVQVFGLFWELSDIIRTLRTKRNILHFKDLVGDQQSMQQNFGYIASERNNVTKHGTSTAAASVVK